MNRQQFSTSIPANDPDRATSLERFRVTDVVLKQSDGRVHLWVSYHLWNPDESCFTLSVSTANADVDAFLQAELSALNWETLYVASPCLTVWGTAFVGHEAGGKMAVTDGPQGSLFLTTGDHGFNGLHSRAAYSQVPEAAWGKVIKIDLKSGEAVVFTSGHRNAQGIFFDNLNRLWLTEHGPRGGDELNLLEQGKNYGWPLVTYGTDYGTFDPWPLTQEPGHHDGFERPVFAWVPSIGVSDVIRLEGDLFPFWKGDIIAGSLREQSLYRVHIRKERVILVERIEISKRIRDMAEGPNGEIVLWTDNDRMIFIEPAPHEADAKP